MTKLSVVDKIKALYVKDETMQRILSNSSGQAKTYTSGDGAPLSANSPILAVANIPCLPFNKVIQVAGKPDTGKSTIAAEVMSCAQRAAFEVIVWDAEDKLDLNRFEKEFIGNPAKLHINSFSNRFKSSLSSASQTI